MPLSLGIDLGTSSAKVLALDAQGRVRASAFAEYPLSYPAPGGAEQQPEDWWSTVCGAVRRVLALLREKSPALDPSEIRGVALSGQMNGAVLVDRSGALLRPVLIWLDRRSEPDCRAANDRAGDLLKSRALHVLNPVNTLGKLLWLRSHEPQLYREAARLLLPKDWIVHRLTGQFCSDVSDASATAAFDLYRRDWSGEILEGFRRVGVPVDEIRIGEGGARSSFWCRMLAAVFGSEVRLLEVADASPLGAALIAGVGTGVFPGFSSACDAAVQLGDTILPDEAETAVYERGYRRFAALYPALRDWYHQE